MPVQCRNYLSSSCDSVTACPVCQVSVSPLRLEPNASSSGVSHRCSELEKVSTANGPFDTEAIFLKLMRVRIVYYKMKAWSMKEVVQQCCTVLIMLFYAQPSHEHLFRNIDQI